MLEVLGIDVAYYLKLIYFAFSYYWIARIQRKVTRCNFQREAHIIIAFKTQLKESVGLRARRTAANDSTVSIPKIDTYNRLEKYNSTIGSFSD